ncbi:chromate transporter [Microvirga alba]|uniref:Chromate transporter n=1 Tax=Microvirga alba TaxID=2791025 RepID=A0A931BR46_9HYPH|nr:chromate transporter [Microvirga alba]MBF9235376.1 chromate transporter [Microvirga alba]
MRDDILFALVAVFVPFSLMSIGGGSAVIAGIQHETVVVHNWITPREFVDLFAVARAAPGPGSMLSTLIGWKVAGWPGAIVATIALIAPSSLLCYATLKLTNTHRDRKWHRAMREGLAPVGVGLVIAGCITIFRLSGGGVMAVVVATLSTALLLWRPNFPVLILLCLGALLSAAEHLIPVMSR